MKKIKSLIKQLSSWLRSYEILFFLVVFFLLIFYALSFPPERRGDGSEYILKTESLIYDQDLKYEVNTDLARHNAIRIRTLDTPSGLTNGLDYNSSGKSFLTRHGFYYSLFAIPFYLLFKLPKVTFAYYGFQFFNAVMLFFAIIWIYKYVLTRTKSKPLSAIISSALLLLSPVLGYSLWIHPETFLFFLVTGYLYHLSQNKTLIASIFLGLAAGQQPPLILLSLLILPKLLNNKIKFWQVVISGFIILILFSPQYLLNKILLGNYFPIMKNTDVTVQNFSIYGLLSVLFDPAFGLIWFYPMSIFILTSLKRSFNNLLTMFLLLITLSIFTFTCTIYSHQIGFRYLNYLYPLIVFLDWQYKKLDLKIVLSMIFSLFCSVGILFNSYSIASSANFMNFDTRTFLPYQISKELFNYLEYPQIFNARSQVVNANPKYQVRIENGGFLNGNWLISNKPIRLLFYNLKPGLLEVKIDTPVKDYVGYYILNNGKSNQILLKNNKFTIHIDEATIKKECRLCYGTSSYLYLDLFLNGWNPQLYPKYNYLQYNLVGGKLEEIIFLTIKNKIHIL